jgi:hypothetical protein
MTPMMTPIQKCRQALAMAFMLRDRAVARGDTAGEAHLTKAIDQLGEQLESLLDRRSEMRQDAEEDVDSGDDE